MGQSGAKTTIINHYHYHNHYYGSEENIQEAVVVECMETPIKNTKMAIDKGNSKTMNNLKNLLKEMYNRNN